MESKPKVLTHAEAVKLFEEKIEELRALNKYLGQTIIFEKDGQKQSSSWAFFIQLTEVDGNVHPINNEHEIDAKFNTAGIEILVSINLGNGFKYENTIEQFKQLNNFKEEKDTDANQNA